MTTMTRTTRKAPWAAVLTALLAVVALVFGALAFAGVASAQVGADQPDNPGNSENAPGHDVVPPGHQEDGTPGNSDGVPGGGNDNNTGPTKVWICHADTNNNGDDGLADGTGGEYGIGYNVIEVSINAWLNGHEGRHPMDKMFATEAEAIAKCLTTPPPPPNNTVTGSADYSYTFCVTGVVTPVTVVVGTKTAEISGTDQAAANAAAAAQWDATAQTNAVNSFLANNRSYTLVPASGVCVTEQQAAEIDAALAAVAPVEAATVTEEPETVAVPAPATVPMPATVPAGDGSSVPPAPVALLALLALATAAAVTSGLRLAVKR